MLLLLEERSCSKDAVGARVKPILFDYSFGTRMETYLLHLFPRGFAITLKALETRALSLGLVPSSWTLCSKTFLGTSLLESLKTVFGADDSLKPSCYCARTQSGSFAYCRSRLLWRSQLRPYPGAAGWFLLSFCFFVLLRSSSLVSTV